MFEIRIRNLIGGNFSRLILRLDLIQIIYSYIAYFTLILKIDLFFYYLKLNKLWVTLTFTFFGERIIEELIVRKRTISYIWTLAGLINFYCFSTFFVPYSPTLLGIGVWNKHLWLQVRGGEGRLGALTYVTSVWGSRTTMPIPVCKIHLPNELSFLPQMFVAPVEIIQNTYCPTPISFLRGEASWPGDLGQKLGGSWKRDHLWRRTDPSEFLQLLLSSTWVLSFFLLAILLAIFLALSPSSWLVSWLLHVPMKKRKQKPEAEEGAEDLKRGKWQAPKTGWKNHIPLFQGDGDGGNLLGQPQKSRRGRGRLEEAARED